jgi:hypothetical protein
MLPSRLPHQINQAKSMPAPLPQQDADTYLQTLLNNPRFRKAGEPGGLRDWRGAPRVGGRTMKAKPKPEPQPPLIERLYRPT